MCSLNCKIRYSNFKIIAYILSIIAVAHDEIVDSQKKEKKAKLAKSSTICEMNDFVYFSKNSKK